MNVILCQTYLSCHLLPSNSDYFQFGMTSKLSFCRLGSFFSGTEKKSANTTTKKLLIEFDNLKIYLK